jgi:deazaflavin-dependent oxidoreductase (nitroreductase family)
MDGPTYVLVESPARPARADRYRRLWRFVNRVESVQVRWLGTSGIALVRRTPVLLLETTGRRSGRTRRAPVAYWERDGRYLVGGGAAGMSRVDWVANLRSSPDAAVWVARRRIPVRALELHGDDYEQARAEAFTRWPDAPKYEQASGRRIPYFALHATVDG